MACVIETDIAIDADPQSVWSTLTDLSGYAQWNPFIVRAEGRLEAGMRLSVRVVRGEGRTLRLRPVVLMAVAPVQLRWLGRLGPPGLLDVEQGFVLESSPVGAPVHLVHRMRLEGFLALLLRRRLERELLERCEAMNEALKRRVEVGAG